MRVDHKVWLDHFEYHATRRCVMPPARFNDFTAWERRLVGDSLAAFQRAEQLRGRLVRRAAQRYEDAQGQAPLAAIVALLIAEKQHHAALLGDFMDEHGLPRKERSWLGRQIRRVKSLVGFEAHMSMLVTDALISKVYYRALEAATGCRQLQVLCRMLVADELAHVGFEADLLLEIRDSHSPKVRTIASAAHRAYFIASTIRAWLTHRRVLRAAGYRMDSFIRACLSQYAFHLEPVSTLRPAEQAAKVAPFAAGSAGVVRKSAAGEFCQLN